MDKIMDSGRSGILYFIKETFVVYDKCRASWKDMM